ncbi:SLBB domain-containing protein [Glacieibacterium frigidum]|uniref:Capsular biosynthesis protein n=1 Tax=Glacieibacterium frigidum TaxID=2593303 RepID=A0A552UIE5_9SPHN|nr:SLBB domain-containing protein [Glacieibacterium frigidum]TRW17961.1 capsular biosynthesis protein [Glacieibacterium frigidum]
MRRLMLFIAALFAVATSPAAAQTTRGYVLGVDDAIVVSVYGQPDAGTTQRIKADGSIVVPLIGKVEAAGETVLSLASTIEKKFVAGGFFKAPVVNVEIGTYVSRTVNVAGKITQPGVYPLDRTYRVLEVLLKAGWVKDAGANYVYLRRADGKEQRLETEALVRGSADKDPVLAPGDTLYVPDADMFYVYGQINRPGTFPVLPGMSVRQAIAIAGGVTASGSDRKVGLYRAGAKEKDEVDLDQPIQKNDVIVVKERLF